MKFGVVTFPGSNCDHDLVYALRDNLGQQVVELWHKDHDLQGCDFIFLPGGFSYGDYLRCGAIAKVGGIMKAVADHAARGGYVLGVCNGFQILTECGLLPGALTRNLHLRFECRDVFVKVATDGPFSPPKDTVLRLPIAHGEGRYQASKDVLARLEGEGHIAFRYCEEGGAVTAAANPNGSLDNIAGIYGGPKKNVLGLMPHPERMSEACLGGTGGLELFQAVVRAA